MKIFESYFCNQDKRESYPDRLMFEGEIERHSVVHLADGGIRINSTQGDEFGNEFTRSIELDRFDLMLIQDLIK